MALLRTGLERTFNIDYSDQMKPVATDSGALARRAARFGSHKAQSRAKKILNTPKDDIDIDQQIVGTCQLLEKCYLRLTSAPKQCDVRPKPVLIKSLARVKELWRDEGDYKKTSELLKSIRQDLTVQGIRDQLSIDVYETHARFALRAKDHAEFNICQSVLRTLYTEVPEGRSHQDEFTAYRILYYIFIKDLAELAILSLELLGDKARRESGCVEHAMRVVKAWLTGSYHRLLKLYVTAPHPSSLVMDFFIDRERATYFEILVKAYSPSLPASFVSSELELKDETRLSEFLTRLGGVVFVDELRTNIDCKATLRKLPKPNSTAVR